jgi:glycerol dehydrogenase-like iron-containing ADH family enzyme
MKQAKAFDPNITYQKLPNKKEPVALFISPYQYIQGKGAINMIGEYVSLCVSGSAGILITPVLEKSLASAGLSLAKTIFQGESSVLEVERVAACFRMSNKPLHELKSGCAGSALSRIVEANILLSGIGFESGGLAGAHAVAQGLTVCSDLHKNCLHGELVAIGVMSQLIMEKRMDEAQDTARFFKAVGLPLHLEQLGFDTQKRHAELDEIVRCSLDVFFMRYEPFEVTHNLLKSAIIEAGRLGKTML